MLKEFHYKNLQKREKLEIVSLSLSNMQHRKVGVLLQGHRSWKVPFQMERNSQADELQKQCATQVLLHCEWLRVLWFPEVLPVQARFWN